MSQPKPTAREPQSRDPKAVPPRNPYFALALRRAAGSHRKPEKAQRQEDRIELMRRLPR